MISDAHLDYKSLSLFNDSLLCTDSVHSNSFGVAGEPISDLLRLDSTVNLMMLGCMVVFLVLLARFREFFVRQLSAILYETHADEIKIYTTQEHVMQIVIIFVGSLLLSFTVFFLATQTHVPLESFPNKLTIIAITQLFIVGYLVVKGGIQYVANVVFFGRRRANYFYCIQVFLSACTSILLFPITLLLVYSVMSVKILAFSLAFVLVLNKLLTFYKTWAIFFRQNGLFLQIFLYFCTLEIAPLAAAGGIWFSIFNGLK